MPYHALVPAAGNGFRFGAGIPKQYLPLRGKPVLQHTLDRLVAHFPLTRTYVVLAPDDHWFETAIDVPASVTLLRCGGATRAESVRNALACFEDVAADDWIVVHDAVRPCLSGEESLRLRQALEHDDIGGFLAVPVSDTLKRLHDDARVVGTESRESLWRAQTPQMFRYGLLTRALASADLSSVTDEAGAVEALGVSPRLILGNERNIKVTYPEDLALAELILNKKNQ